MTVTCFQHDWMYLTNHRVCCTCLTAELYKPGEIIWLKKGELKKMAKATVTNKEMAKKIGNLVDEKNKAYGDSFNRAGKVLAELYPDGVKPKEYRNMLSIIRIIDKLFRVANDQDAFGEDPWQDIVGYGLLACGKKKMTDGQKEEWRKELRAANITLKQSLNCEKRKGK